MNPFLNTRKKNILNKKGTINVMKTVNKKILKNKKKLLCKGSSFFMDQKVSGAKGAFRENVKKKKNFHVFFLTSNFLKQKKVVTIASKAMKKK
jgi:hypothetical protein